MQPQKIEDIYLSLHYQSNKGMRYRILLKHVSR